jgi:hypothetical protein
LASASSTGNHAVDALGDVALALLEGSPIFAQRIGVLSPEQGVLPLLNLLFEISTVSTFTALAWLDTTSSSKVRMIAAKRQNPTAAAARMTSVQAPNKMRSRPRSFSEAPFTDCMNSNSIYL